MSAKENKTSQDGSTDNLKELERLLEKDVLSSDEDDEKRLVPRRELTAIMIRLSVIFILSLLLFFIGIFDNFVIVLFAVLIFGLVEAYGVWRNIRARKNTVDFK